MNIEYTFDRVMARLKTAINASNDGQLARKMGLSSSAYANLKARASIPHEKIILLAISHNVSLDWLLTGQENQAQHTSKSSTPSLTEPRTHRILQDLPHLTDAQINRVEALLEDFLTFNHLINEVTELKEKFND